MSQVPSLGAIQKASASPRRFQRRKTILWRLAEDYDVTQKITAPHIILRRRVESYDAAQKITASRRRLQRR